MNAAARSRGFAERATWRARLTRTGVAVVFALAMLFVYYAWTATSSGNPFTKPAPYGFNWNGSDYYNLQVDAFLHGRLSLDVPIDPTLADSANPYALDVPRRTPGLADGSFYNGKYYLSWGPAPAVTTFLPPRLVGVRIRENLAVTLYCFFGVLLGAMTLARLVDRLVPDTPRVVLWMGSATLALATAIPWILRRPTVYEVAITAAFFFMMAGLLVLVRELLRDAAPRRSQLAGTGTLFGLAVLSRPSMGFVVLGVAGLAWALRRDAWRAATAFVVGIPVAAGAIFMIYNMARFSGPLDFGNQWQTTGRDVRHIPFNDLANLPPALYGYLLAPLRLTVGFPYIHLPPPPNAPFSGKDGFKAEETAGIVWAVPFVLLALVLMARRRGRERDTATAPDAPRVVLALLAIAALALIPTAFAIPGYTERYELDFLPWLAMAGTIGWAALIRDASTPKRAARWRRGGIVLAAWGILIGVAIGFTGYYDSLNLFSNDRFRALERLTSPVPTLMTTLAGRPMIAWLGDHTGDHPSYTTVDVSGVDFTLVPNQTMPITIMSPGGRDARLTFRTATETSGTFSVAQTGAGDATSALVRDGSVVALPLRLKRGVNYIDVSLSAGPDVAEATAPVVALRDLRVH